MSMCKEKDIPIKDNTSKEELIEKLITPVLIDLTNNYDFIKELENNLRDRIKDIQEKGSHREIKIRDASFDIEIENQDLFEMLKYVMDRMTLTWDDYYEPAEAYYEHHGNSKIPKGYKTINGYEPDENGIALGNWLKNQKSAYKGKNTIAVTPERIKLLEDIGVTFLSKNTDEKLQQEQIISKNLERKKKEIQNRFYSVLNNFDSNSLPSSEELNQKSLEQLNTGKKSKGIR